MFQRPEMPIEIEKEILLECGHRCAICGVPISLEQAHIIPWHESKEYKAEDFIALCANCHERADRERWAKETLIHYKQKPWVSRQYEKTGDVPTSKVTLTIHMELEHSDKLALTQYAIASLLGISPNAVGIISIEKEVEAAPKLV